MSTVQGRSGRVHGLGGAGLSPAIRRDCFPALADEAGVAYLDSASTTQLPQVVLDAVAAHLSIPAANPGRGSYPWATRASRLIAAVREQAAGFIGAGSPAEVVFTSGATASLNAVALCWGLPNLRAGDEILFNPFDHVSNVYPWRRLRDVLARSGTLIKLVPYGVTKGGEPDLDDIRAKLSPRTRMVTLSHLHGLFGALSPVAELREQVGEAIRICLDCSQSAGHLPLSLSDLSVDFAAFSAHKMLGLAGTGIAYFRRDTHAELGPFLPGGTGGAAATGGGLLAGAVGVPGDLEAGTVNITGIAALGAAVGFLAETGTALIAAHERDLTRQLIGRLREIPQVGFLPGPASSDAQAGHGIVSFRVAGARSDDVGFALSMAGFYVRAGRHCQPPGSPFDDSLRVSMHMYNSGNEVDRFADCLASLVSEV